jgi:dihydroxyacid dehydratase/phosphogluconate dehydratase
MSVTAYGTVVLHVAPEAAAGGPLAVVQTGDEITLDVPGRTLTLEVSEEELLRRRPNAATLAASPIPRETGSGSTSTTCSRPTPAPTSTSSLAPQGIG